MPKSSDCGPRLWVGHHFEKSLKKCFCLPSFCCSCWLFCNFFCYCLRLWVSCSFVSRPKWRGVPVRCHQLRAVHQQRSEGQQQLTLRLPGDLCEEHFEKHRTAVESRASGRVSRFSHGARSFRQNLVQSHADGAENWKKHACCSGMRWRPGVQKQLQQNSWCKDRCRSEKREGDMR